VRWIALLIGVAVSLSVVAQEAPKKKKKPAAKEPAVKQVGGKSTVRGKPTPEQIRKFNELQKKK
jgi:hypothetical protein